MSEKLKVTLETCGVDKFIQVMQYLQNKVKKAINMSLKTNGRGH